MGKVILLKKETVGDRRCLNCGKDISHLNKNAKYCTEECGNSYRDYVMKDSPQFQSNHDYKVFKYS